MRTHATDNRSDEASKRDRRGQYLAHYGGSDPLVGPLPILQVSIGVHCSAIRSTGLEAHPCPGSGLNLAGGLFISVIVNGWFLVFNLP